MTVSEVVTMFKSLSFPVEPDHVSLGTKVPFGEYEYDITPFSADGIAYINRYSFMLRVYVPKLNSKIDKELSDLFKNNEIVWTRSAPIWIDDSKVYELDYEFGVIGE